MSRYFVLDGPDGAGKSVQAELLCSFLRKRGLEVEHLREPGSTAVGEALRNLLLDPATGELRPVTEALLVFAARAQMVSELVEPALATGRIVVAERSYLSTMVYQGLAPDRAEAVPVDFLKELVTRTHGATLPDAMFVLDVDSGEAERRRRSRVGDRFEERGPEFHERVREGYLSLAQQDARVHVIAAGGTIETVHQLLCRKVGAMIAEGGR